jgi:hypothetical protein
VNVEEENRAAAAVVVMMNVRMMDSSRSNGVAHRNVSHFRGVPSEIEVQLFNDGHLHMAVEQLTIERFTKFPQLRRVVNG